MAGIKGAAKALAKALRLREGPARKNDQFLTKWQYLQGLLKASKVNVAPLWDAGDLKVSAGREALTDIDSEMARILALDERMKAAGHDPATSSERKQLLEDNEGWDSQDVDAYEAVVERKSPHRSRAR